MAKSHFTNPVAGQHLRFVRYVNTRDGWTSETRRGELEERTAHGWRVRVLDDVQELPEAEWSIYQP